MHHKLYLDDLIHFFSPIHKVKTKERSGWVKHGIKVPETLGAHTFGAAHLAWLMANAEGANSSRAINMVLMNGLLKADLPDLTPASPAYFHLSHLDPNALGELAQHLPSLLRTEYQKLFEEYEGGQTLEAQIATEANKLDTLLQAISYEREIGRKIAAEFFNTYQDQFKTKTGKQLYQQLKDRSRRGFRLKKVYDVRVEESERERTRT